MLRLLIAGSALVICIRRTIFPSDEKSASTTLARPSPTWTAERGSGTGHDPSQGALQALVRDARVCACSAGGGLMTEYRS
jgi:hypothetical protein